MHIPTSSSPESNKRKQRCHLQEIKKKMYDMLITCISLSWSQFIPVKVIQGCHTHMHPLAVSELLIILDDNENQN